MSWNRRHRIRSYLQSSLWIIPIGAVVIEQLVAAFVHALDARLGWAGAGFGLEGARVVANAVITLTLSFVVFTFGSLLVAIQVASGQYTPRIIATTLLRDNVIRYMIETLYVLPEDLALARIPDSQGLGGSTDTNAPKWAT